MVIAARQLRPEISHKPEDQIGALIAYLREVVLVSGDTCERGHAIFLDAHRRWLGDANVGMGSMNTLSLRMRTMFGEALRLDARGMILAHNHPSGHCRPSGCDIAATRRLANMALALDIELIDHLIFTHDAAYSMRAGGML